MPTTENRKKTWMKAVTAVFILKVLKKGPAHGNKIADEIKRATEQTLSPNPNFLYPLLRKMEQDGYVIGNWENPNTRGKKIYDITEEGIAYFLELQEKVKSKFAEMERKMNIIKKHLFE